MQISLRDNREPLAAAFAINSDHPAVPVWKDQLASMVIDVARKFHGSQNELMLRTSLRDSVLMCSIGILEGCSGGRDPAEWARFLAAHGIRGSAEKATALARSVLSSFPDEEPIVLIACNHPLSARSVMEELLKSARSRGPFAARDQAYRRIEEHRFAAKQLALVKHLVRSHTKARFSLDRLKECSEQAGVSFEEFLLQSISRLIGVPEDCIPPMVTAISFEEENEDKEPCIFLSVPKSEMPTLRANFDRLIQRIPDELQEPLISPNWFSVNVRADTKRKSSKAPSKVDSAPKASVKNPKKPALKKPTPKKVPKKKPPRTAKK